MSSGYEWVTSTEAFLSATSGRRSCFNSSEGYSISSATTSPYSQPAQNFQQPTSCKEALHRVVMEPRLRKRQRQFMSEHAPALKRAYGSSSCF